MAGTLAHLLDRDQGDDWKYDMKRGLSVIGERSEALSRFMSAYARLARLPEPTFQPVDVDTLVRRVSALQTSYPVEIEAGPPIRIQADGDQLEQLLINLLRNAADAAEETKGRVRVRWAVSDENLEVFIEDEGPGLSIQLRTSLCLRLRTPKALETVDGNPLSAVPGDDALGTGKWHRPLPGLTEAGLLAVPYRKRKGSHRASRHHRVEARRHRLPEAPVGPKAE